MSIQSGLATAPEGITPDGITPVQGYRFFRVHHACRLSALGFDFFWNPGGPTIARCMPPKARGHGSPEASCTCGLYAMKRFEDLGLAPGFPMTPSVAARVELWGKVIEATLGYRAQYGRVVELIVLAFQEHLAAFVADAYGVPLRVRTPAEMPPAGLRRSFPWMPPSVLGRTGTAPSLPNSP